MNLTDMFDIPALVDHDRKNIQKLFSASLLLILFFLPLNIRLTYLFIAITAILWVLNLKQSLAFFDQSFLKPIIIFTMLYVIQIAGLIRTDYLPDGLFQLEKKLSMFIFPMFFFISPWNKNTSYWIWRIFLASVLLACLISHIHAFYRLWINHLPFSDFFTSMDFQTDQLIKLLELHPTYVSLFIILLLIKLALIFNYRSKREKWMIILLSGYFTFFLFQLASRAALFSFVVVFIFLAIYRLAVYKNRKFLIVPGLILLVIFSGLLFLPHLRERLTDPFVKMQAAVESPDEQNSAILHAKSWHCAIECWEKNILFGNGTGDERNVLGNCYLSKGWRSMSEIRYDAHNEYLSSLVRHGVVGLVVLVFSLFWTLNQALKRRDQLYACFMIIIVVSALAESILRGEGELIFFTFFNSFFYRNMIEKSRATPQNNPSHIKI
jgi:O-antigen ligase